VVQDVRKTHKNESPPGDRGGRIDRRVGETKWGGPERTAQRWAQDRFVRREVGACRRRAINEAIGRTTRMSRSAVDGIVTLA
jgi:hypothetical protein